MNDCAVCGKPDHEKPMTFRGSNACSEMHRKIMAGEFGTDVGRLFEMNLVSQDEATRLWGTKMEVDSVGRSG
jgi:hypothetical protein